MSSPKCRPFCWGLCVLANFNYLLSLTSINRSVEKINLNVNEPKDHTRPWLSGLTTNGLTESPLIESMAYWWLKLNCRLRFSLWVVDIPSGNQLATLPCKYQDLYTSYGPDEMQTSQNVFRSWSNMFYEITAGCYTYIDVWANVVVLAELWDHLSHWGLVTHICVGELGH